VGKAQLFIDRHVTFRRDANSSTGVDREEVEANQLGAALLMPRGLVQQEVRKHDLNLDGEKLLASWQSDFKSARRRCPTGLRTCGWSVNGDL
jgi:hypothetical protein